ncbi:MAG: sulfite exporter TauE/SafE family protein [Coriobacteriia bacterium]|nr:sulfite exporter TauE/SafE family protein [Coriobacteriia bacterium]MDI6843066.1 sulfite exporter TauE/SafE family protein [Anaerosomatales bacterium]
MNLFLPMLGIGLVTSVHCVAMCGPLVLTYAVKGADEASGLARLTPHVLYHAARLTSYVVVGLLMGSIGDLLGLGGIRGWVTLAAGFAMVLLGLQMTGRFPALSRLMPRTPAFVMRALKRLRGGSSRAGWATPVAFGLVTGLMPCGPLISAQVAAAGTGSAAGGALAMLGFGLGTMPLMFGFGAVSGILSAPVKRRMMAASAVLVAVLGLVMVDRGLNLVGSPVSASRIVKSLIGPASATEKFTQGEDGVVEVPLVVEDVQFKPAVLEVPADQPVRLVVDRREDNACSAQLAVPQAGVLVDLAAFGTTVIELPPLAEGRYTLTCGMGMMSGEIRAVAGKSGSIDGRSGQQPAAARPKIGKDTGYSCACCGGGTQGPSVTGTATVEGSVQRITVDTSTGRYVPDVVVLARGIPAEITFTQASGCLQVVEIPDLDVSVDLSAGPVTVLLPALEPGTYGFNCGMRMVFGQIVVE